MTGCVVSTHSSKRCTRARRVREIRRHDGNINSEFYEDNRPSHQESRQYQKALFHIGDDGRVGNKGEVVTRHP